MPETLFSLTLKKSYSGLLGFNPSWVLNNVSQNKATQAQRVLAFPAVRSVAMPETLFSLTLEKSYSGLQGLFIVLWYQVSQFVFLVTVL